MPEQEEPRVRGRTIAPGTLRRPPMEDLGRPTPKIELYRDSEIPRIEPTLANLDEAIRQMHDYMPVTQSETLFRIELDANIKIFLFMMLLGVVMVITAVLWSI
jgi:hypothetical protein